MTPLPAPPLLLISDRKQATRPLVEMVAAAFAAGCRWVSLREKDLTPAERNGLLTGVVAMARPYGATVTVHGDVEAAARTHAAGVHLPASGDIADARRALGGAALIGISCHNGAEVEAAARAGADYATLGPLFLSASKPGYGPALGPAGFSAVARRTRMPLIALGGIEPPHVAALQDAGAAGIAVMGSVMRARDPGATVAALLAAITPPASSAPAPQPRGPMR